LILDEIVAHKLSEIAERERQIPVEEHIRRAADTSAPRKPIFDRRMSLIGEVKRRSPSAGELTAGMDPATQARAYEVGGAVAISVLTDAEYFGGSFEDLTAVRDVVQIPVLCKDFILAPYQVYEARGWGADLLLLVVGAISDDVLFDLHARALAVGMTPLVEVHDQHELARALAMDARLIGINNRDLSDFSVDLLTTEYLAPLIPDDVTVVSESGIATRQDVERVAAAGARVVLVGETLMRAADPATAIRELVG
jgi:indole-3-glycerol phosphate synthase